MTAAVASMQSGPAYDGAPDWHVAQAAEDDRHQGQHQQNQYRSADCRGDQPTQQGQAHRHHDLKRAIRDKQPGQGVRSSLLDGKDAKGKGSRERVRHDYHAGTDGAEAEGQDDNRRPADHQHGENRPVGECVRRANRLGQDDGEQHHGRHRQQSGLDAQPQGSQGRGSFVSFVTRK